jgi:threonine/homoserine/homoserine lactone efflux protein
MTACSASTTCLFIISGLLLNIMPGPGFAADHDAQRHPGLARRLAAALGIGAGTMVHIFAAALGLSAMLATSATAFTVVKYIGAAYIVWMAIGLLRSQSAGGATPSPARCAPCPTAASSSRAS